MRTGLTILFILLLKLGAASGRWKHTSTPPSASSGQRLSVTPWQKGQSPKDSVRADTLIALAKTQLGKNYCYAVSDPDKGFDCSGFVYFVFQSFKISVPRSSKEYKNYGKKIPIDSARAGDVIVFTGTNAKKRGPGHVGIVIKCENGIPTFIHSSSGKKKGVIVSDFNESPYYKKRFIKIVRVAVVY
jgi:murein DD-endopeptidase / murein LD-carboxypeptidase